MPSIKLDNFAGGQSDIYIDGMPTTAKRLRNVFLDRQGKPFVRPGCEIFHASMGGRSPANSAIYNLHLFEGSSTNMLMVSANSLYYQRLALDGNSVSYAASTIGQVLFGNGSQLYPVSNGLVASDRTHAILPVYNEYIGKVYFDGNTPYAVAAGLPIAAAPALSASPTVAPAGTPSGTSLYTYNYYIVLKRTYTIGGVTYIDRGIPYLIPPSVTGDRESKGVSYSFKSVSSPPMSLDDFANITIPNFNGGGDLFGRFGTVTAEVYRTNSAQVVPYYLGEANLGTTYQDQQVGYTISGETLYTYSGAAATGMPPRGCSSLAIINGTGWYVGPRLDNAYSSSDTYGSHVLFQSVPGDVDGVPEDFFYEFDTPLMGIGQLDIFPIVFEKGRTWRIEGQFNVDGSGGITRRLVSNTAGCVNAAGVRNIGSLLVFPGEDQFYATDGYSVKPYSPHLKETYQRLYSSKDNSGYLRSCFSPKQRRAFFSMGAYSRENTMLVLEAEHSSSVGSFVEMGGEEYDEVTYVGASTMTLRRPVYTSVAALPDGRLLTADSGGYLYVYDERYTSDPVRDENLSSPTNWIRSPVVPEIITAASSFGSELTRKWITSAEFSFLNHPVINPMGTAKATYYGGTTVTMNRAYQEVSSPLDAYSSYGVSFYMFFSADGFKKPYKITGRTTSGYSTIYTLASPGTLPVRTPMDFFILITPGYLSADLSASNDTTDDYRAMKVIRERDASSVDRLIVAERSFPKKKLRCTYKQMKIRGAYQTIAKSDNYCTAETALVGFPGSDYGTALLTNAAGFDWPDANTCLGQWLHLENDGYSRGYRIMSRSADTLHLDNSSFVFPAGTYKWEIRGYAKDERLYLNSIEIPYQEIGTSISPYLPADSGRNA